MHVTSSISVTYIYYWVKRYLQVLFCSSEVGRTSFVRQLEADFHIDTSLDIISQLSRFIRCQLFVSSMEGGQLAANVFNSPNLERFFSWKHEAQTEGVHTQNVCILVAMDPFKLPRCRGIPWHQLWQLELSDIQPSWHPDLPIVLRHHLASVSIGSLSRAIG